MSPDKERALKEPKNQLRDRAAQMRLEVQRFYKPEQIEKFGSIGRVGIDFGPSLMTGYGQGMGHQEMMGHSWGMDRYGMWQ